MPVPGFQDLMLPMLLMAADGANHRIGDVVQALSNELQLTEADRDERLSSGQQVIYNRTHWAATYLVKAGLLERAVRGSVRITPRGLEILGLQPARVDIKIIQCVDPTSRDSPAADTPISAVRDHSGVNTKTAKTVAANLGC